MSGKTYLVTGASDGIGAVYADRLARRGYDLILVARRADRLEQLAADLHKETGIAVDVIAADLSNASGLAQVEERLRSAANIVGLVNNAGIAGETTFDQADVGHLTTMIDLNVLAVARLSAAVAPRFAASGSGTIINIASVTALMPAMFPTIYPATKAFVIAFSEALAAELGPKGVRVQTVLPGATRTPIWTEEQLASLDPAIVMEVDDMVDAAFAGLDMGEVITIPALPESADLDAFLAARAALYPNLSRSQAAERYRS